MTGLIRVLGMASAAVLAGGFAMAAVQDEATTTARKQTSVVLAVAPPDRTLAPAATVEMAPAMPQTPPLPQRAPRTPSFDFVNYTGKGPNLSNISSVERALTARPAPVRAGPSETAPMMYGFPAKRPVLVVGNDAGYAKVIDYRSGASGWIEKSALGSNMLTASVEPKPKPVRQAKAEIKTPKAVTGIPREHTPMLLGGGGSDPETATHSRSGGTNFANFVRRGFGAN